MPVTERTPGAARTPALVGAPLSPARATGASADAVGARLAPRRTNAGGKVTTVDYTSTQSVRGSQVTTAVASTVVVPAPSTRPPPPSKQTAAGPVAGGVVGGVVGLALIVGLAWFLIQRTRNRRATKALDIAYAGAGVGGGGVDRRTRARPMNAVPMEPGEMWKSPTDMSLGYAPTDAPYGSSHRLSAAYPSDPLLSPVHHSIAASGSDAFGVPVHGQPQPAVPVDAVHNEPPPWVPPPAAQRTSMGNYAAPVEYVAMGAHAADGPVWPQRAWPADRDASMPASPLDAHAHVPTTPRNMQPQFQRTDAAPPLAAYVGAPAAAAPASTAPAASPVPAAAMPMVSPPRQAAVRAQHADGAPAQWVEMGPAPTHAAFPEPARVHGGTLGGPPAYGRLADAAPIYGKDAHASAASPGYTNAATVQVAPPLAVGGDSTSPLPRPVSSVAACHAATPASGPSATDTAAQSAAVPSAAEGLSRNSTYASTNDGRASPSSAHMWIARESSLTK
ncbi:hypothetical protein MSPP1_000656 [Malassezia sp. CBS 17886]|nr:hypothetical protein MSPP1_000656 [Malassezia sp. CBS 17886]